MSQFLAITRIGRVADRLKKRELEQLRESLPAFMQQVVPSLLPRATAMPGDTCWNIADTGEVLNVYETRVHWQSDRRASPSFQRQTFARAVQC